MRDFELINAHEAKLREYEDKLDLIEQTEAEKDYAQGTRKVLLERQLDRFKEEANRISAELREIGDQLEGR